MSGAPPLSTREPDRDCPYCPRLVAYREEQRASEPSWHNAPVPTFGDVSSARLLIVGLAPGRAGANRTGRPFTGDYAGLLLYASLVRHGFALGTFEARPDDGLQLVDTAVTNAVRCVPPQNKPTGAEITTCRAFLATTIEHAAKLRTILALGRISHDAVIRTLGEKLSAHPFAHGARHTLPDGLVVTDSYHPSRYNVNTGVLTEAMFDRVVASLAQDFMDAGARAGSVNSRSPPRT